jgi:hypothetical protein
VSRSDDGLVGPARLEPFTAIALNLDAIWSE